MWGLWGRKVCFKSFYGEMSENVVNRLLRHDLSDLWGMSDMYLVRSGQDHRRGDLA